MNREDFIKTFDDYVSDYDLSDAKIKLKYIHTGEVAKNAERIAESLALSKEDQELCWEIGMLHDIGRFEQLRRYDTFMDADSIDHAEFGADLLFKEGLIERFDLDTSQYDELEQAVRYHSRYRLPEGLSDRQVTLCQIIRDADKVDILRANYVTGMEDVYNVTTEELKNSLITPEVYDAFCEGHAVLRSLKRTPIDHLIGHLSLTFEIVYPESKKIAVEQGYVWKLACYQSDNPKTREVLDKVKEKMRQFSEQL
ncbi:MAG: HD domain-containing protein [Clostridia bacterium]|nr:HD domain-containing protein [Clostridia bacterium]NCC43763.1 HD domain-containing protein [Clostridia bacterium]